MRESDIRYIYRCFDVYVERDTLLTGLWSIAYLATRNISCKLRGDLQNPATDMTMILSWKKKGGVSRSKRRKSEDIGTLCIICNQKKVKGETKLYRICDNKRAKTFISAYRFNQDDVFSRCSIYTTAGDVFAADLFSHEQVSAKISTGHQ